MFQNVSGKHAPFQVDLAGVLGHLWELSSQDFNVENHRTGNKLLFQTLEVQGCFVQKQSRFCISTRMDCWKFRLKVGKKKLKICQVFFVTPFWIGRFPGKKSEEMIMMGGLFLHVKNDGSKQNAGNWS